MNYATPSEIQLALRAPGAGWLGVLACVLDEASRDPNFNDRQRQLVSQLLQQGPLTQQVVEAARRCAACFESELDNGISPELHADTRPKLTLVGTDR